MNFLFCKRLLVIDLLRIFTWYDKSLSNFINFISLFIGYNFAFLAVWPALFYRLPFKIILYVFLFKTTVNLNKAHHDMTTNHVSICNIITFF